MRYNKRAQVGALPSLWITLILVFALLFILIAFIAFSSTVKGSNRLEMGTKLYNETDVDLSTFLDYVDDHYSKILLVRYNVASPTKPILQILLEVGYD